jgi:long-chain acyl-CoA synthetase
MSSAPSLAMQRAESRPMDVAVRLHDLGVWRPITWSVLMAEAAEIGSGFRNLGIGSGDVVALLMSNHPTWLAAYLGIQGVGAVVAPIDPDLASAQVANLLETSGAKAVVCGDQEMFDKVDEEQQRGRAVGVAVLVVANTRGIRSLDSDNRTDADRILTVDQLRRRGNVETWKSGVASVKPTDVAVISASGATTHQEVLEHGDRVAQKLGLSSQDRVLAQTSFADPVERSLSIVGLLKSGVTVVVGEGGPLAHAELQQVQPTVLHAAPGFLDGVAANLDRRIGVAKGLRKLALRRGWRPQTPPTSMARPAVISPLVILLLVGVTAALVWLGFTAKMEDPMRLLGLVAIALVIFAASIVQGSAVVVPIRRQLGLTRVRAVVSTSNKDGANMLGALRVPLLHPSALEGTEP